MRRFIGSSPGGPSSVRSTKSDHSPLSTPKSSSSSSHHYTTTTTTNHDNDTASTTSSSFFSPPPISTEKLRARTVSPPPLQIKPSSSKSKLERGGISGDRARMQPVVAMATPRSAMGIKHWASDTGAVAERYTGLRLETAKLAALRDEVVREGAKKGEEKVRQGLVRAVEIAEQLFQDLQVLGFEFANTLENEKTVTLQLQLANLAITDQRRKLESVLGDRQRLEKELKDARQQLLNLQLKNSLTSTLSKSVLNAISGKSQNNNNNNNNNEDNSNSKNSPALVKRLFGRKLSGIAESAAGANSDTEASQINLKPETEAEQEKTIDHVLGTAVKQMSREVMELPSIPGLDKYVQKVRPNVYNVAGYFLNLEFRDEKMLVRVGGGFVDFADWCKKHQTAMVKYIQVADSVVPEEDAFDGDEGPRRYSVMEPAPKLNRRLTPSMILRNTDSQAPITTETMKLRKTRSSANLVYNRKPGEEYPPPPPPEESYGYDDAEAKRRNTVAYMMNEAMADEQIMVREREKLLQRHKDEVEKLASALESEKLRQQAKVQSEIRMKQEINELLELRVKVEQYRGQRDEAMLHSKTLRVELDSKEKEIQAIKQQAKFPVIDTSLQQQQVQVLRQQRDEANATLRALRAAFEEQSAELATLKAASSI